MKFIHRFLLLAVLFLCFTSLSQAQSGVTFTISDESVIYGNFVTASVSVQDFVDVTTLQGTIRWDEEHLEFISVGDYGLPGMEPDYFGVTQTQNGILTFSWDDEDGIGVTVPDESTIFTVTFKGIAQYYTNAPLFFSDNSTLREVSVDYQVVDFISQSGSIEVIPDPTIRNTVFLTNSEQIESIYGAAGKDLVLAKLDTLCLNPKVRGEVVDVSDRVSYTDWINSGYQNSEYAKDISDQIWDYLNDSLFVQHPMIQYVVLIGDDRVIPHRRVPEKLDIYNVAVGQENTYAINLGGSYFQAVCDDDYLLVDDFYGTTATYNDTTDLFVPQVPVGRLIGDSDDIALAIDAFLESNGTLNVPLPSAVVSSNYYYDDSAKKEYRSLLGDMGFSPVDSLFYGYSVWNSEGIDGFFDTVVEVDSVLAFISQHGNHQTVRAASNEQIHCTDIRFDDMRDKIWVNLACHSGLAPNQQDNWSNTFAAGGMPVYISPTAFSYFGTHSTLYTERILTDFAKELTHGNNSIGLSFWAAKQAYFNYHSELFDNYDKKCIQTICFYGLPMYSFGQQLPSRTEPMATIRKQSSRSALTWEVVEIEDILYDLVEIDTIGMYYTSNGGIISAGGKPILPLYRHNLNPSQRAHREKVHGIVMESLEFDVVDNFNPVINKVGSEELTSNDDDDYDKDDWAPGVSPGGLGLSGYDVIIDYMYLVGQYRGNEDIGELRLPTDADIRVFRSGNDSDWDLPTLVSYRGDVAIEDSFLIHFEVKAIDASGIQAVFITYTNNINHWYSIQLEQNLLTDMWEGDLQGEPLLDGDPEYIIQVVDGAGNVCVWHHGGDYYGMMDLEGEIIESNFRDLTATIKVCNAGVDSSFFTNGLINDDLAHGFYILPLMPGQCTEIEVDIPPQYADNFYVVLDVYANEELNIELDETDNVVWGACSPAWNTPEPTIMSHVVYGYAYQEDGTPLPIGSQVGAFDSTYCAGRDTITDENGTLQLYIYGEYGDLPGFAVNEPIELKIFNSETCTESEVELLGVDQLLFTPMGTDSTDIQAISYPTITISFDLCEGFNLISLPIIPGTFEIDSLLAPIAGKYRTVQRYICGDGYDVYYPAEFLPDDFNTLELDRGYWIDMIEPATLTISGTEVTETRYIPLCPDFNLVGWTSVNTASVTLETQSIADQISTIQRYDCGVGYKVYYPPAFLPDDFDEFHPKRGYWIDAEQNIIWSYDPDNNSYSREQSKSKTMIINKNKRFFVE